MTKSEMLLNEIKRRGGMTRKEMVEYLLDIRNRNAQWWERRSYDSYEHRDTYNATLYGTSDRTGILENFCRKNKKTGKYKVVRKISAPFTTAR